MKVSFEAIEDLLQGTLGGLLQGQWKICIKEEQLQKNIRAIFRTWLLPELLFVQGAPLRAGGLCDIKSEIITKK